MGRLYDAYVEVGPRFAGFGDIKSQGDKAGREYGKALAEAAAKAAAANVRKLGEALAKARSGEADAAGKVRVAEQKLAETRAQSNAKLSQITAAEEALAAAQRKSAAASGTAKSAAEALEKGRSQAARAADDVGKATGGRFTKALRGAMSKSDKDGAQVATRFGVGFNGAIGGIVSRSAGVFAAGFAGVQLGGFLKGAIGDASNLGETMSKSAAVFGPANAAILKFASTADTSLGQTEQQAIAAASQFGNMFNQLGIGQKPAAKMSTQMVKLASDFASFHNADISEVLEAQSAAFRGEYDSIQKFVPTINAAAVEQEGLRLHLAGSTKELTDQDKAIAVQSLLLRGAGKATGDFARTSGGLANQQRILSAQFGNFKASIGQVAIPLATKLFTFLNDKGAPALKTISNGVQGFGSALRGEGVTSDGFVGAMERIGVKARVVFDFFKAEVLPRLKDFGGFIIGTVVPAVVTLATNLASTFGPVLKDIFGFVKAEVIPRLKDFAGFIGDKIVPKLASMAESLSKNKDFLLPFVGTILAVVTGLKAWAVIQAILNAELFANPIGLVVLAIAALVGGIVWAYKNVGWFHDAVDKAFHAIVAAGKFMWDNYLKGMFGAFRDTLQVLWEKAQTFASIVSAAWGAIKEPARIAIKFVVDTFLGMVKTLLDGAVAAFGWVPKLGDKLKSAAAHFDTFAKDVNKKLDGIKDQNVNVALTLQDKINAKQVNSAVQKNLARRGITGFATGGDVNGGTPGVDSVPALLMPGEHVLTKGDVKAMGGQQAVYSFRGQLHKFATGGAVDFNVNTSVRNPDAADTAVGKANAYISRTASAIGSAVKSALTPFTVGNAPSGPPGAAQSFRGQTLNARTIRMLLSAESVLGRHFRIMQGSYSTRVAASGGTHAGGGAMDTDGPGGWDRAVRALRGAGFASWHRTPAQGPWGHHIHSIAIGDSSASPSAKNQVKAFLRGGDGLGHGMRLGGAVLPVRKYDTGGPWPPGTFGYNGTGKTETVRTAEQEQRLGGPLQVRVFIGSKELTDIVRVEIDEKAASSARSYNL